MVQTVMLSYQTARTSIWLPVQAAKTNYKSLKQIHNIIFTACHLSLASGVVAFTMLYEDSWDLETLRCLARRHMHWIGETGGLNKKPAKEIDSVALKEFKRQCLLHGG
ncbi:hypothetical protein F2Q69_00001528 [Brassica cretica]|uniref:Uncharacterized protein n=1 Tax=Brassica cretica TaxID=69181 RepID=A0A8S9P614_BRACR|nr:hypothetical protein F2Q69_00001528 [Brassica cretica]